MLKVISSSLWKNAASSAVHHHLLLCADVSTVNKNMQWMKYCSTSNKKTDMSVANFKIKCNNLGYGTLMFMGAYTGALVLMCLFGAYYMQKAPSTELKSCEDDFIIKHICDTSLDL